MKTYRIGILHGDGIGEEIVDANLLVLKEVLEKCSVQAEFLPLPMGLEAIDQEGTPLSQRTKGILRTCDAWILGPHDSVSYPEKFQQERNPSGELRYEFDLFANIRPAKKLPNSQSLIEDIDLVIYRENTEGYYVDRNMYAGVGEFQVTPDVALSTGVFTRKAIERIAHAAFSAAMRRNKKVTIVHKANVIRLGSGMFLNVCKEMANQYPDVNVDDYHMDAMTAHLVRRASDFDVIVTENMFGDILSDLTGELAGSLGLAPSINRSETQGMAQAAHGSAPDIAGKNIANPIGIMHSTVMLLKWLSGKEQDDLLNQAARLMGASIQSTILNKIVTPDLGGTASTFSFAQAVANEVQKSFE